MKIQVKIFSDNRISEQGKKEYLPQISQIVTNYFCYNDFFPLPQILQIGANLKIKEKKEYLPQISQIITNYFCYNDFFPLPQISQIDTNLKIKEKKEDIPQISQIISVIMIFSFTANFANWRKLFLLKNISHKFHKLSQIQEE